MPVKTIEELREEIDESREPCARAFADCARYCRPYIELGKAEPFVPESFLAHSWVASVERLGRVTNSEEETDGVVNWLKSVAYCIAAIPYIGFDQPSRFSEAIVMLEDNLKKIKTLNAQVAQGNEQ